MKTKCRLHGVYRGDAVSQMISNFVVVTWSTLQLVPKQSVAFCNISWFDWYQVITLGKGPKILHKWTIFLLDKSCIEYKIVPYNVELSLSNSVFLCCYTKFYSSMMTEHVMSRHRHDMTSVNSSPIFNYRFSMEIQIRWNIEFL